MRPNFSPETTYKKVSTRSSDTWRERWILKAELKTWDDVRVVFITLTDVLGFTSLYDWTQLYLLNRLEIFRNKQSPASTTWLWTGAGASLGDLSAQVHRLGGFFVRLSLRSCLAGPGRRGSQNTGVFTLTTRYSVSMPRLYTSISLPQLPACDSNSKPPVHREKWISLQVCKAGEARPTCSFAEFLLNFCVPVSSLQNIDLVPARWCT